MSKQNRDGALLEVCTRCAVRHYENCRTCLGFGVYDRTASAHYGVTHMHVPVLAGEAIGGTLRGPVVPCPECNSTERGVPSSA